MIFFVREQQKQLQNHAFEVSKRKKAFENQAQVKLHTPDVKAALDNANHAYGCYLISTKSIFGKFLSFIPGRSAFEKRIACINRIAEAENLLREVDKKIKASKNLFDPTPIHRSISAPLPELPKCYPSPIAEPKRKKTEGSVFKLSPETDIFKFNPYKV
jgi:hypothetical protein